MQKHIALTRGGEQGVLTTRAHSRPTPQQLQANSMPPQTVEQTTLSARDIRSLVDRRRLLPPALARDRHIDRSVQIIAV